MQTVTKTEQSPKQLADRVQSRKLRTFFGSRKTRDQVALVLKHRGVKTKKTLERGARLHPEHIADFEGIYETGFGNTDYQTTWAVLYGLEVVVEEPTKEAIEADPCNWGDSYRGYV